MPAATDSKKTRRGGRKGNDSQPGQQRSTVGARDGNANTQQTRRGGAGKAQNQTKQSENVTNGPTATNRSDSKRTETSPEHVVEEHIPVNNFNSQDVRENLKGNSGVKAAIYKPVDKPAPARSASPWASKRQ